MDLVVCGESQKLKNVSDPPDGHAEYTARGDSEQLLEEQAVAESVCHSDSECAMPEGPSENWRCSRIGANPIVKECQRRQVYKLL